MRSELPDEYDTLFSVPLKMAQFPYHEFLQEEKYMTSYYPYC